MQNLTNRRITGVLVFMMGLSGGMANQSAHAAPRQDLPPLIQPPRDAMPNRCEAPLGKGTTHNSISAPETWTAAGSPHYLPYDTSITAPVTIQPCAVVRIAAGRTISISGNGALIVAGAPGYPVIIQPQALGMEWAAIRNSDGILSLSHAIVAGGGAAPSAGALQMSSIGTVGTFHVDDVEIIGSRSTGVYINGNVGFDATSQDLRIHGSLGYPVRVLARVVGSIPRGDYTGNAYGHDAIAIAGVGPGGAVINAQAMHDRGVPYHVGAGQELGRMDVSTQFNGPAAVLTIDPGVTIRFPARGSLNINASNHGGTLIAIGTAAQPIVFTSDQGPASAAGNWLGLIFNDPVSPQSVMQHVRVEFAGGPSGTGSNSCPYPADNAVNDAAIRIYGQPSSQFISDSEIFASAHHGIDRGWKGGLLPDFLASNTFTSLARCRQTMPTPLVGNCPGSQNPPQPVPCPQ
jgi:hypothetical protein